MIDGKLNSNRLVTLQFLVLVLPVGLLLIMQTVADGRRAAALEFSRPLRVHAQEARAQYKTFFIGVTDAVDTGALSSAAYQALLSCNTELQALIRQGADPKLLGDIAPRLGALVRDLPKNADLATLLKLRSRMREADEATRNIAAEFDARDEAVMRGAIQSARTQQVAVAVAIVVTAIMTLWFVIAAQRRLTARRVVDQKIAEESLRLKNALNNCSAGIMVADPSGTVVYADRAVAQQLHVASPDLVKGKELPWKGSMESLAAHQFDAMMKSRRAEFDIGNRTFLVSGDRVRAEDGRDVGLVLEWSDRTEQAALEREVASIVEAATRGEFDRRIELTNKSGGETNAGFYAPLVSSINRLLETAEANLDDVGKMLEALAQGNLRNGSRATIRAPSASSRTIPTAQPTGSRRSSARSRERCRGHQSGIRRDRGQQRRSEQAHRGSSWRTVIRALHGGNHRDCARHGRTGAFGRPTGRTGGYDGHQRWRGRHANHSHHDRHIPGIRQIDIGVIDRTAPDQHPGAQCRGRGRARAGEHGREARGRRREVRDLAGRSARPRARSVR